MKTRSTDKPQLSPGSNQGEFPFCEDEISLAAPPPETRATCCIVIPEQRDHPQFYARCFADEPRCKRPTPGGWPRPDFRKFPSDGGHPPPDTQGQNAEGKLGAAQPLL
jgi:hypothetical protein